MSFADWQRSRGIEPWTSKPQHRAAALRLFLACIRSAWSGWVAMLRRVMAAITAEFRAMVEPMRNLARAFASIQLPPLGTFVPTAPTLQP